MTQPSVRPDGQIYRESFPRFGLSKFAKRFPSYPETTNIRVRGHVRVRGNIVDQLAKLERREQRSDFHCVTTWSAKDLHWSGYRFIDVYEKILLPLFHPDSDARLVRFQGQDGYGSALMLDDLLTEDVLLADRLNGEPLGVEHGAPIRLVAPAHYGYKNVKHLSRIEFLKSESEFAAAGFRFMDHPRARVEFEERGRGLPGPIYRYLYRPLVASTVKSFKRALVDWRKTNATVNS